MVLRKLDLASFCGQSKKNIRLKMNLKKGLDLPILGEPEQVIHDGPAVRSVAVNAADFIGLKPRLLVSEGDSVKTGQPLFIHKDSPEIQYTSPASGRIRAINRGARRALETIVIDLSENNGDYTFAAYLAGGLNKVTREEAQDNLYKSGLWTSFRTRPYSKVPSAGDVPNSIFVTAMDSNPLAADASVIIEKSIDDFNAGLEIIAKLTDGKVHVCHAPNGVKPAKIDDVKYHTFSGPHPAGLAGTHIHFIEPVHSERSVWSINYQDVISIGRLFLSGRLDVERVIALAGPLASKPRLISTRVGASTLDLTEGEIKDDTPCRVISGSVLTGRHAVEQFAFLGRYDTQITLMEEDRKREVLGWLIPRFSKYSFINVHLSSLFRRSFKFPFGTNLNGSPRAMVPLGSYERVIPMDILPTQLLRAILVKDTDQAQKLGVLELAEEDLALCSFICHSKYEYGEALRATLDKIEKEG